MFLGRLLTLINFALLVAAVVVYVWAPQYGTIFLYGLIAWMFASLVLFYLPISRRRLGTPLGPPPGAPLPSATAAPGPAAGPAPGPVGFCIWCAHDLPPGAGFCPGCGRPVRRV